MNQFPRLSPKASTARSIFQHTFRLLPLAASFLVGCGSSSTSVDLGSGSGGSSSVSEMYTVGGTISGLASNGLILSNNGVPMSASAGATTFSFTQIPTGMSYAVLVEREPLGLGCSVASATGSVGTANVNNVVVTCSAQSFGLGGTVSGLTSAGLVLANGTDRVSVPANAIGFTLPQPVAVTSSYAVTVATQPQGLVCAVSMGTGTMPAANVTGVAVTCSNQSSYALGGTVSGLNASGLVLANGNDTVAVPANATQFALAPVRYNASYSVTVATQPTGETCTVSAGSGTMPAANVGTVAVVCSDRSYTLSGTIGGLNGVGLVLANGIDQVTVGANGTSFILPTAVAFQSPYAVTVATQPAGETCTVSMGSGTMPAAEVTNVAVTCSDQSYTLGGTISRLTTSGLILSDGTDRLTVAANAAVFSLPTGVAYTSSYTVTVAHQPTVALCTVMDGTGTMPAANVASVQVNCVARAWTWESGSDTVGQRGVYIAAPGVPATPGARDSAMSWTDASGHFWLFGGGGYDVNGSNSQLNDLWSYDPGAQLWTWVGGSTTVGGVGVYGAQGVAAAANVPGARNSGMTWTDSAGRFWLFGGYGVDLMGTSGYLNDLWSYDPATGLWTWVSGSPLANGAATYGNEGTPGANNVPGAREAAVTWIDKFGHFWLFGGYDGTAPSGAPLAYNDLWSYDPAANQWTWMAGSNLPDASGIYTASPGVAAAPGARANAMSWTDATGVFWLFGGDGLDSTGSPGFLDDSWSYDPSTQLWTFVSGHTVAGSPAVYGAQNVAAPANTPGARAGAVTWTDSAGHRWLLGGTYLDGQTQSFLNDLWFYDPSVQQWTWVKGSKSNLSPPAAGIYGSVGMADPGNTPGARVQGVSWIDGADHLWMFGGYGYDSAASLGELNDLWQY